MLAVENLLEALDGIFHLDEFTGDIGKYFRHVERLGQKTLDFPSPGNGDLIFLGKFIHPEDGNDVLQGNLDSARHLVVLFTDDIRIENSRGRIQRINRRINAQLSKLPGENNRPVKVGKGGCRCRVGQVVGRNVYALNGGNRAFVG